MHQSGAVETDGSIFERSIMMCARRAGCWAQRHWRVWRRCCWVGLGDARDFLGFGADAGGFGLRLAPFLGIVRGGGGLVFAQSSARARWSVLLARASRKFYQ